MGNSASSSPVSATSQIYQPSEVIQTNFPRIVNAIQPAVGDVARKAFGRNLITRQNMSDAENLMLPVDHRASTLLRQIHDRIETDETQFETFMAILRDVPILRDLAGDICSNSPCTAKPSSDKKKRSKSFSLKKKKRSRDSASLTRGSSLSSSEISAITANQSERRSNPNSFPSALIDGDSLDPLASNGTPQPSLPLSITPERDITMTGESPIRSVGHRPSTATNSQGESDLAVFSLNGSSFDILSPDRNNSTSSTSTAMATCQPFQCRCGKNCTLDSFVKGSCLQAVRESVELFPFLKLEHLTRRDKEKLVRKLTSEARKMFELFADLVVCTFDSLKKQEIPVEDLKANALTFGQQKLPRPYSEDHIEKLSATNTVRDIQIFLVGYKYISFFNYGILQKIIEMFGTDKDKANLADYLSKYTRYCKRSVFEVPSTTIQQLAPEVEESLVVKVNEHQWFSTKGGKDKDANFTMEDLYAVEESIAEVIGMEGTYILLRGVKEGCVELSLSVLSQAVVFPLTYLQRQQLSSMGIDVTFQDVGRAEQHLCTLFRSLMLTPKDLPLGGDDTSSGYGTLDTTSVCTLESPLNNLCSLLPRILPQTDFLSCQDGELHSPAHSDYSGLSGVSPSSPGPHRMPMYSDLSGVSSTSQGPHRMPAYSEDSAYHSANQHSQRTYRPTMPGKLRGTDVSKEALLMVMNCLMHNKNCQIPNCPCGQVQERFRQMVGREFAKPSRNDRDADTDTDTSQVNKRRNLRLNLSSYGDEDNSQSPGSPNLHPHYHLTSKSYLRHTQEPVSRIKRSKSLSDLTPLTELPECPDTPLIGGTPIAGTPIAGTPIAGTPVQSLAYLGSAGSTENLFVAKSKVPVILREISISADNLPTLCMNDCPLAASPVLKNRRHSQPYKPRRPIPFERSQLKPIYDGSVCESYPMLDCTDDEPSTESSGYGSCRDAPIRCHSLSDYIRDTPLEHVVTDAQHSAPPTSFARKPGRFKLPPKSPLPRGFRRSPSPYKTDRLSVNGVTTFITEC